MTDLSRLVRPLVWNGSGEPEPWENFGWEQYTRSAAGTYRVFFRHGVWRAVIHCLDRAHFIGEADTLDAAKAAAQADYTARILAALDADALAALVEAGCNLRNAADAIAETENNGAADAAIAAWDAALARVKGGDA